MAPRNVPPPHVHHRKLETRLSPHEAETYLSTFISQTSKKPHLHPDSVLSTLGVQFPPTSGAGGGLTLHHLRRIAQGLGGTNLVPETWEELAKFGVPDPADEQQARADYSGAAAAASNGKRKRRDEIEQWAETSSQVAATPGAVSEVESFAVGEGEWQSQEQFEQQQREWEGEVGDRAGANIVRQNGAPPEIVQHGEDVDAVQVNGGIKAKTKDEKAARKAEKAARKLDKRRKMAQAAG